ncbi:hexose transporter [Colletotrichum higginsianum]|nr:hexose transporter [Colletotrichum higginsianum]
MGIKPAGVPGKAWPAIAIGFFVAFGGLLFGYDTGTINGILEMSYWQRLFSTGYVNPAGNPDVSPSQESAIVSILSAGTFFGALASPLLADSIGRRLGLAASCWVFNLGVVLQTIATDIPVFLAGRFFAGFGVGLISALVPLYQSETAPKWIRGAIVGAYQWAITIGLLLAAIVNNATHNRQDTGSYRIPIAIQFAWSIILFVGMIILPETPRFLIKSGHVDRATKALAKLRRLPENDPYVAEEIAEIKANHDFETSIGTASYLDCFRPRGINFIFYYGTQYFQNSGFSNGFVIGMITSSINVVSTIPGMYAVDRWGRRPMLLWGAVGMCVSQFLVAMLGTLTTGQDDAGKIIVYNLPAQKAAIAFVCIYIFFFASTWGPLAWVVNGEIFGLKTRAKSLSLSTATNSKIFFVWFACCFLCIAFVYFFIYETKGLTLEEVEELYAEVSVASKSANWRPATTFRERQAAEGDKAVPHNSDGDTAHHEKTVDA